MKKFSPYNWMEIKPDVQHKALQGRLQINASKEIAVYVEAQGVEALAQVGTQIDLSFAEAVIYRIDAPQETKCFLHVPPLNKFISSGEVFTNIDRTPDESGAMLEVRKALRTHEINQRAALADIRKETHNLKVLQARARGVDEPSKPRNIPDDVEVSGEADLPKVDKVDKVDKKDKKD